MRLPQRLEPWRALVVPIAAHYKVDPALLLAVVDRETNGKNVIGDHGFGIGLGQVDKRSHPFASCEDDTGKLVALDPWMGLSYSARLLRRLLDTFSGEVAPALAAYNAGAGRVRKALNALPATHTAAERVTACDSVTTGKNYSSDTLRRRDSFTGERGPLP